MSRPCSPFRCRGIAAANRDRRRRSDENQVRLRFPARLDLLPHRLAALNHLPARRGDVDVILQDLCECRRVVGRKRLVRCRSRVADDRFIPRRGDQCDPITARAERDARESLQFRIVELRHRTPFVRTRGIPLVDRVGGGHEQRSARRPDVAPRGGEGNRGQRRQEVVVELELPQKQLARRFALRCLPFRNRKRFDGDKGPRPLSGNADRRRPRTDRHRLERLRRRVIDDDAALLVVHEKHPGPVVEAAEVTGVVRLRQRALFPRDLVKPHLPLAQQHQRSIRRRRGTEPERARNGHRYAAREIMDYRLHRMPRLIEHRNLRGEHQSSVREERWLVVIPRMLRDVHEIGYGEPPARHVERSHPDFGVVDLGGEGRR